MIRIASFTDGTSNTVVMSESVQSDSGQEKDGLGMVYDRARLRQVHRPGKPGQSARLARRPGLPEQRARSRLLVEGRVRPLGRAQQYSHTQTPNRRSCYWTNVKLSTPAPSSDQDFAGGDRRPWSPPARTTPAA